MDSLLAQIFSIILVLGALITIIPLARQVFRRSRERGEPEERGRTDQNPSGPAEFGPDDDPDIHR